MTRWSVSLAIVPMVLAGLIGEARAFDDCETDADCVDGFACEIMEVGVCEAVSCIEGEECPEPVCTTESVGVCVPTTCTSDDDCGEGLRCMAVTFEECPDIAVAPPCVEGEECPEPEPVEEPECETAVEHYCLPQYVAPCTVDADCGEGFECIPEEVCGCAGSDPEDPEPPAEPDCFCEPTGENLCSPIEVECETDDACPVGWTCGSDGDVPVTCGVDPETGEEHCEEPEPDETGVCYPPFWELDWYGADDEPGALEMATGSENPRAELTDDRVLDDEAAGCNMTAVNPGSGASTLAFLLPLLIAVARRKR